MENLWTRVKLCFMFVFLLHKIHNTAFCGWTEWPDRLSVQLNWKIERKKELKERENWKLLSIWFDKSTWRNGIINSSRMFHWNYESNQNSLKCVIVVKEFFRSHRFQISTVKSVNDTKHFWIADIVDFMICIFSSFVNVSGLFNWILSQSHCGQWQINCRHLIVTRRLLP